MAKIYSKNSIEALNNLKPKEETLHFILNYSKALHVITSCKMKFELVIN